MLKGDKNSLERKNQQRKHLKKPRKKRLKQQKK